MPNFLVLSTLLVVVFCRKPHIILIVSDDMGWYDVGFHGSNQIPTPNIDALAYNGVVPTRLYTHAVCTPSRAAILTGVYPMRFGFQSNPMRAGNVAYIPFETPTLAEHLKNLGYQNYMVGKWHLGYCYRNVTPMGRGFDEFYGVYGGNVHSFTYEGGAGENDPETGISYSGFDLHNGFSADWANFGKYTTDSFTDKAIEYIKGHDNTKPMFLYLAYTAVHADSDKKMRTPDTISAMKGFPHITNPKRRIYADVLRRLDDSIGAVMVELHNSHMLDDSIVIFVNDNGGKPSESKGIFVNSASTWPLRGCKSTFFEGGIRGVAAIFSPLLKQNGVRYDSLMHLTDILPTVYSAAGGNPDDLGQIDGVSQWEALKSHQQCNTPRKHLLVDLDEKIKTSAYIEGRYKLYENPLKSDISDGYFGGFDDETNTTDYDTQKILDSPTNGAIKKLRGHPKLSAEKILEMRSELTVDCRRKHPKVVKPCKEFCFFDIYEDPCEMNDLSEDNNLEGVVQEMKRNLEKYWREYSPQYSLKSDPKSDPVYFNMTLYTWLEEKLNF